jgi:hypothetical protein
MYTILCRKPRPAQIIKPFFKLALLLLLLTSFKASAQSWADDDKTYGIGLRAEYDMPIGNLKFTYKAAPAAGISFYINEGAATAEVGLGYREYKPKLDTFYYLVNDNDYGTATYSKFKTIMFYLGGAYNLSLSDAMRIYGGFNLGFYFTKFSSNTSDAFVNYSEDITERQGYIAPKLGFNFTLSDHLRLNVQGAYNLFAPLGKAEYNSRVGTFYYSVTTGAAVIYNF